MSLPSDQPNQASLPAGIVVALTLVAAFPGPDALAQTTVQRLGRERPEVTGRWRQTLEESDQLLAAGEWKRVRKTMDRLLTEMCGRIESGEAAAAFLATAAVQRAIAQAGLGNDRDASWDWEMAVGLRSAFAELAFEEYGEAGARLSRIREVTPTTDRVAPGAAVEPPRRRKAPPIKYPHAKRVACLEDAILVHTILDREGRLHRPRLDSLDDPVLGFAAMDALRGWRYEPARVAGRPVAVEFRLTVNFNIPLCRNLMAVREKAREQ